MGGVRGALSLENVLSLPISLPYLSSTVCLLMDDFSLLHAFMTNLYYIRFSQ